MAQHPDVGLTQAQVEAQYAYLHEHPHFPRADWKSDIDHGDADCGYWEWVVDQIDACDWE